MTELYEPTWESIDAHAVPDWFEEAKLGIWVHWGVYSVPAWAPPPEEPPGHAYAEWYPTYMYREGNRFYEYHRDRYGADVEYADFIPEWTAERFDPERWAAFFEDVGARYVAITAEHHDGFPLWDTEHTDYNAAQMGPERDVVRDLEGPVRDRGMKYVPSFHALLNYYQPDPDAPVGHPNYGTDELPEDAPSEEYVAFMNAKLGELLEAFEPDLLWLDGDWAGDAETFETKETVARYYNLAEEWGKEVAVNDRLGMTRWKHEGETHGDFYTPEYDSFEEIEEHPWEACRGIGHSFGYNRREGPEDYLSSADLVHTLVDVVSKNGNLLLNVGPKADGTIPEIQKERLAGLGAWLDRYGEAIYGTTYWETAEDDGSDVEVRYTWKAGRLYAIALAWPGEELRLGVPGYVDVEASELDGRLLGSDGALSISSRGDTLVVELPERPVPEHERHAYAIELDGVPNSRSE